MITLVDTSVWSLALRRSAAELSVVEHDVVKLWSDLITSQQAYLIGIVRQEILSGIKSAKVFQSVRQHLNDMPHLTNSLPDYDQAAEYFNFCSVRGVAATAVDMLICATSARNKIPVLSVDVDFERYQKLLPFRLIDLK
jgi:predicted nucleic acid-binding protein